MLPLTVAIIARDEADRIAGAVRSIPEAAEVLVLDSGSNDGTPEVARALGARVVETDWPGHVAQKNRALSMCDQPWVLFLDADEWTSPALAEQIRAAVSRDGPEDGFLMRRRNRWLGRPIQGGRFGPAWHLRLVRRERAEWGGEDPHDRLAVQGRTARLDGPLEHAPYRDLGEHLATIDRYTARFVEVSLTRGRRARLADVLLRPPIHFVQALALQGGVRDGVAGWILAWLGAVYVALKWGRLWMAQSAGARDAGAQP